MTDTWEVLPGETPIDDISGLKIGGITTRAELNVVEAANIRKVIVKYLSTRPNRRTAPFDYSWSLKLHKEMFGDVWDWAGALRKHDLNIGPAWEKVEQLLYGLMGDLAQWGGYGMEPEQQAVRLHHRAVAIHPFQNGNGRWARMLANIWLKQQGQPLTVWPEEAVGGRSIVRDEYIAAIKRADEGDYEPLANLHRRLSEREEP